MNAPLELWFCMLLARDESNRRVGATAPSTGWRICRATIPIPRVALVG